MGKRADSRGRRGRIDAEARRTFLLAARGGATLPEAAAKAGFSVNGFYSARKRDPLLRLAWDWAMELSAIDQRAQQAVERAGDASGADVQIAPNNKRRVQLRRKRRVVFTERRQELFLCHFAQTADATAAAEAAGVHETTVYKYRRRHPEFAEAWQEALEHAFVRLEAEALRQRLEAQRKLKEGMAAGEVPGDAAMEFERVLKLLQRWDRKGGRPGPRGPAHGRMKRWTFEEAIEALDKKLRAVNIPIVGEEGEAPEDEARGAGA